MIFTCKYFKWKKKFTSENGGGGGGGRSGNPLSFPTLSLRPLVWISGSRLSKKNSQTTNINLVGYNVKQTPTESSADGVPWYIS